MKKGDKLIAKKICIVKRQLPIKGIISENSLTIGKQYEIKYVFFGELELEFTIINDLHKFHSFVSSDIGDYFYTKKEERKLKLEKIEEIEIENNK